MIQKRKRLLTIFWGSTLVACQHAQNRYWSQWVNQAESRFQMAQSFEVFKPQDTDYAEHLHFYVHEKPAVQERLPETVSQLPLTPEWQLEKRVSWEDASGHPTSEPLWHPRVATHFWKKNLVIRHRGQFYRELMVGRPPKWEYHRVQSGETLQKISLRYYGTTRRYLEIFVLNTQITHPDRIKPGMRLKLWPQNGREDPPGSPSQLSQGNP